MGNARQKLLDFCRKRPVFRRRFSSSFANMPADREMLPPRKIICGYYVYTLWRDRRKCLRDIAIRIITAYTVEQNESFCGCDKFIIIALVCVPFIFSRMIGNNCMSPKFLSHSQLTTMFLPFNLALIRARQSFISQHWF